MNETKIIISMFSSSDKVKGQGVDSAYVELLGLLKDLPQTFHIVFKKFWRIDIAHFHTVDFKHFLAIPLLKTQGKVVATVHFLPETIEDSLKLPYIVKEIFYRYLIRFYKSMDYLVVVNPSFIEKLENYGVPTQKIIYIPNFVSENDFHPLTSEQINYQKKLLGIPKDKFVVFGTGQVQLRKGVLDFIEVAKKLPDVQFLWAGGFSFGKITAGYKQLKAIVENPPPNIKFLGIVSREKMNYLYNVADLFFLPSYHELFPMSILEALACHRPVLLRDLPEYRKILEGYYLKGSQVDDFVGEIKNLRLNQEYYKQAKHLAEVGNKYYSKEYVLSQWTDFYQMLYNEKRKKRKVVQ